MKPQQHPDLEIDQFEEEEEEEEQDQQEFGQKQQQKQKYTALATLIALTVVLLLILLGLKIAASLEEIPKIYMEYQQEAYQPRREQRNGRYIQLQQVKPSFEEMVKEVKIDDSSLANMVEVEASNSIHRNYQQTMRRIQAENAHMQLDKHKSQQFSKASPMTYQHYLQALDLIQLTTFPPDQYSNQQGKLVNQERLYYNQKYSIRSTNTQNSICVVLALTREGLQSGGYYLALKSIFQQEYNNFKVVVIDNPEMRMLEDVEKLLREFGRSKITLLERVQSEEMPETSFFVEGAIGKYCKESAMTLLLRDTGELIGKEVFNVINKVYEQKQPEIIFTHYLLEPFNPLRQSIETLRYKIQLYPESLAQTRYGTYRTKYLKVYRTDMLLRLQDRAFQKSDDHWTKDLFQANLQFSTLELSCGRYHLINEILYMASKYDIQTPMQILDARKHEQLSCYLQNPHEIKSQSTQLKVNP